MIKMFYNLIFPILKITAAIHQQYNKLLVRLKLRPSLLLNKKINPESHYFNLCRNIRAFDLNFLTFISTKLASNYAVNLIETTKKNSYKSSEKQFLNGCKTELLYFNKKRVYLYKTENRKENSIGRLLFIHGWDGRATMVKPLADIFSNEGFQLYAPDLIAHGYSDGDKCSFYEHADLITFISNHIGSIDCLVGYSSGGLVAAMALEKKIKCKNLILVGTPKSFGWLLDNHIVNTGMPIKLQDPIKRFYRLKYKLHPDDIGPKLYAQLTQKTLICHDENDRSISQEHAYEIHNAFPNSEIHISKGSGHLGLLKNESTQKKIRKFILSHTQQ